MVCLKRMMFINEVGIASGSASMNGAINKTRSELKDLWTYAGYQDILKDDSSIDMMLKQLHKEYTAMMKIPKDRRTTEKFKMKEASYLEDLSQLFDVTKKSLHSSGLITDEDRDFLKNHWTKTISSSRDVKAAKMVENKVARQQRQVQQKERDNASSPKSTSLNISASSQNNSTLLQNTHIVQERRVELEHQFLSTQTSWRRQGQQQTAST